MQTLFEVLYLLSDFFDAGFEVDRSVGDLHVIGFGEDCICLTVHLLGDEVKLSANCAAAV